MSLLKKRHYSKLLSSILITFLLANISFLFVRVEPAFASPGLTLKWTKNLGQYAKTYIGALAADLNGDGKLEIVVTGGTSDGGTDGTVTALDGTTGNTIWQVSPGGIGMHSPCEIADINKDGIPEIIVSGNYPVVLFGNNGSTYWKNTGVSSYNLYTPVLDIDGDGYYEIFVSSGKGPYQGYDYFTTLSYDGKILYQNSTSWHPCWGGMAIGDPAFNGTFILFQGDRSIDYNPAEDPYKYGGWGVRALDAQTLTTLWNDSAITCSSHTPMLADVDKDGILDVIVANQGTSNGGLAVYRATDGSVLTTGGKYRKGLSLGLPSHSQPTVADTDGDGNLEIITCRNTNLKIWDLYEWKLDATLPTVCWEPPMVGDVTGDGKMDIIAVNGTNIIIYTYNSSGNNYYEVDNVPGLYDVSAHTLLEDVDGDGLNELIVTSFSWRGGYVYCFDTQASAPIPRVRQGLQFYSERHCGAAEYVPSPGPLAPVISEPSPLDGATNVPISLSQLTFKLTDYQHDPISYTVTTNPDIGSGSQPNVPNGRYSIPVSGLAYATTYTWAVTATDGTHATAKTFTFTTGDLPPWYDTDWQYRRLITIDHTKVAAEQTDFPVLIDLTDTNLKTKAQTDGDDFIFTDTNNAKLNHEIELYDSTTGKLTAWVNVPLLSSTSDTTLYMYYGNSACGNQQSIPAVWDTSFKLVLHLDEKTGTHYDSTINGNNGTPLNGVLQGVTGKIDGGDTFDGTNDYIEVPHSNTLAGYTEAFTTSFWIKLEDTSRRQAILNKYNTGTNQRSWFIEYNPVDRPTRPFGFYASYDGTNYREWYANFVPSAGVWYYITVVWEANTIPKFYINGLQVSTIGTSTIASIYNNAGVPLHIARCTYNTARYLKGSLDEIRLSNPARSASYILTCYNNQLNPSTFYTIGTEQALPSEPLILDPNPPKDSTNIPITLSELSFNLTDYQHDPLNFTVTTTPDIGSASQTNVPNGRYTVPVSGLAYATIYNWTVTVTDGTHTTIRTYGFTTEQAPAADDIVFNSNFDMGNLINPTYQTGAPGYRYYTAATNYTTVSFADKHWWFYFSMNNVAGKTITVKIVNGTTADYSTDATNGNRWPNIEPVYSYDNINWQRVPLTGVTFDRTARTFTINVTVPIGYDKIWLAPLPPYNIAKRDALFAEFAANPYLTVTSLGTTPGGQNLTVATITDPAYPDTGKFKSYVIAQQHAGEVPGSWDAEGLIRYLLSDDPTAAAIRRSYIFKIIPIVNVDGVYYGVSRYTPLRSGVQYDLNRLWNTNPISNAQFEVRTIYNDVQAFQPNSFNDMHSTINQEQVSPEEALTYRYTTLTTAYTNFMDRIRDGGWPETVRAASTLAGGAFQNVRSRLGVTFSLSWENPHDELSSNRGVKLTANDWMAWGPGWARGNYLYFGDAKAVLTVSTVGNGSVSKDPDNTTYAYGTSVQLTAIASAGYTFSHWEGDLTGDLNPATIIMTGNKSVTAVFIESQYSLTINVEGSGSVSRNYTGPYYYGSAVQLTAIADPNWIFSHWSGDLTGTTNPATITMTNNVSITAHFTGQNYTIIASVTGIGGTIDPSGSITVTHGQNQTFIMNADIGYHVSDVLIDDLSIGPTSSYTFYAIDQNHTITAVFAQNEYTLTVNIIGSGSVAKNPEETTYTYGETVELTATANTGWTFSGWSGDLTGLTNPAMILMNGNKTVTATFTNNQWFSIDWQYRRTITIDRTKVSGTQTNFPILIDLTDSSLIGKAQLDGDDFLFTSSSNVKLNHEIEVYDSTIGRLVVWVNVPSINSTADTVLYMYYGNPTCGNQQNPAVVWDTSFKLVLHLDEQAGTHYDSTTNGNNGTPLNGVVQGVAGKIDGADTFDGTNDYVEIPHSTTLTGYTQAFTSSFWIRLGDTSRRQAILNKYNQGTSQRAWFIEYNPVDRPTRPFGFYASQDGTNYREWWANFVPSAGVWYYVTVVWEANTIPKFYVNGAQVSTVGTSTIASIYNNVGVPLHIARCTYNTARYLKGSLDEITISNPARSASWILTTYNNQLNPSTFYATGTEETFEESYTLTVITDDHGSVTIDPEKTYYTSGETVTLTAIPDTGYDFNGWSGDLTGTENPATITMTANKIITAHFLGQNYTITASVTGTGGTIEPSGEIAVTHGQNQAFTITPDTGYHILDVLVDGEPQGPISAYTFYAIDNNHTITATFAQNEYTLTVTESPAEGGSVNRNNTGPYYYGDVVGLEAVPASGWAFSHWDGDLSGGVNPTTITINDNKSVTVVFAQNQYTLTITKDGSGSVTKDPDQATYPYGTNVTLTAIADLGWSFSSWSGDLTGSANPATLNITDHKTVTAHFTQDQYTLTVNSDGSGSVSRNASDPYYYGTVVELTAVPDAGWSFSEWTGDLTGTDNPATLNMTNHMTVTAWFTQDQYTLTINFVGNGSVTKNPDQPTYTYNTDVELTATADIGWSFSHWMDDLTGSDNPATIAMTSDKTVTAHFTQIEYSLTTNIVGSGSVSRNDSGPYYYGSVVQLTATADPSWVFSEWSGDIAGSANPAVIIMDGNKSVNAIFIEALGIDASFESASIGTYTIIGNQIDLTILGEPVVNTGGTYTYWTYFEVDNVDGETVTFRVTNAIDIDFLTKTTEETQMVYSYDGENWLRFPTGTYSGGVYTFSTTFTGDNDVYVATFFPFTYTKMSDYINSIDPSPYVETSLLGLSEQGRDIKLVKITNPAIPEASKQTIYIIGRQHASETCSSYMIKGLIDFLLTDDPVAQRSRDAFVYYIVPMVNPDGVYLGKSRVTSENRDANRDWAGSESVEINTVRANIDAVDASNGIDFFIDWHNQMDDLSWFNYIYSPSGNTFFPILSSWTDFDSQTSPGVGSTSARGYVTTIIQPGFMATFEPTPHLYTWTTSSLQTQGMNVAKAIEDYYDPVAVLHLEDPTFDASADSVALIANSTSQDWYESRGTIPGSLTLDENDVEGNTGKKAALKTYSDGTDYSVYLTQEFSSAQTDSFSVSFDINIDRILDTSNLDRGAFIMLGDDSGTTIGSPCSTGTERFVQLCFWDSSPGTSGSDIKLMAREYNNPTLLPPPAVNQPFATTSTFTEVKSGLSYDAWINIRIDVNFVAGTYDVYVNGVLAKAGIHKYEQYVSASITHISFAIGGASTTSFGKGDFYVDNVYAPAAEQYTLTVSTAGSGSVTKSPDKATYNGGESVQLTATAGLGWEFSAWNGDLVGYANPATITMDGYKSVVANFTQNTYTLTVSTDGSGSVNLNNSGPYHYDDIVELAAFPATGWSFDHWSGDLSGSTNPTSILIDGNKAVNATFTENPPNEYSLIVNVIGNGAVTKDPDQATYSDGTTVTLNATPAVGWSFSGWSDDVSGSANPADLLMNDNKVVNATFTQNNYTLTVTVIGNGSVVLNNTGPYHYGDTVQLTANPTVGWSFSGWSGNLSGSLNPATLTVDGDESVTATFTEDQYNLTVNLVGNGSVSKVPDQLTYTYDTAVQLNATATSGWIFTGWTGDLSGSSNPATITMTSNKTVNATFSQILLTDSDFDASANSTDLRLNGVGQDWFESRGGFSGGNSSLLVLNDTDIWGNTGKKASLANYGIAQNAYLTQNFSSAQTGVFSVSFDILIDQIQDNANYDRTGHIYIGNDAVTTNAPTGVAAERFVLLAFYDPTPGTTGTDIELRARTLNTAAQAWATTSLWVQVATGLSYDTWYTIRVEVNVAGGTYDVYVNGVLMGNDLPKMDVYTATSITHITFALDSDARGDFYVDNVFSPSQDALVSAFTIIDLPDTQFYSESYPNIFDNQTQWIVDNTVGMNIDFVLHEGDLVNSNTNVAQWVNANDSMSLLDGHVPWAVLPGNHDGTDVGGSSENLIDYNMYFSYSRFSGEAWYGGAYNDVNTNNFVLFSGGKDDYIIFNFQYHPSDAVLAWANATIALYPDRRAIIVTHDYLGTDRTRTTEGNHIWNSFVIHHADQIFLVLCGHMHGEARREDTVNGHVVYQVLADYQERTNGGDGWLRMLEFHPAEDKIYVKTFSPYKNSYEIDAESQFTLYYDMTDPN